MNMKPRVLIAAVLIPLGLIIAAVPYNTTKPYKLTADQLLNEVISETQFISADDIAQMIIEKNPTLQLIDVRSQTEYEKYSLPGAINIPLEDILNNDWVPYLDQDVKINVFYSNGTVKANQSWMITRQIGYKNNYVMQGGLNYWMEAIVNPNPPSSLSPNEEFAKYEFRKGASQALGGVELIQSTEDKTKPILPPIRPKEKKQMVQGGC